MLQLRKTCIWRVFSPFNYMIFPVDFIRLVWYHWFMKLMKALLVVITVFSFIIIGYVLYMYMGAR
jgi:hypothetical protein